MRLATFFKKLPAVIILLAMSVVLVTAQRPGSAEPRQERLLNGLRVLIWNDPGADRIDLKLRVHSGSSFDPQGKEGVMKMLAEAIFPSQASRDFFSEDLGGDLKVTVNYDYIQYEASATNEEFIRLIETFANALISPTIDNEVADLVRASVLRDLEAQLSDPGAFADNAVQARLFGTFPYGRTVLGTTESLNSIDFADLKFAYDRFFGADNATMTISGNVDGTSVNRVVRRLFGAWLKGAGRVPSTFRQPDVSDSSFQVISHSGIEASRSHVAVRGVARHDKEYAASVVLERILDARVKAEAPGSRRDLSYVRSHAHILPGWFVFGVPQDKLTKESDPESPAVPNPIDVAEVVLKAEITEAEFNAARSSALAAYNSVAIPFRWLDSHTYRLASVKAERDALTAVSLADVRKLAARLRDLPRARVLVVAP